MRIAYDIACFLLFSCHSMFWHCGNREFGRCCDCLSKMAASKKAGTAFALSGCIFSCTCLGGRRDSICCVYAWHIVVCFYVVKGTEIGLTPREYNGFIVYWRPKMQDNPYNLITFQQKAYTETAPLCETVSRWWNGAERKIHNPDKTNITFWVSLLVRQREIDNMIL